jgi:hypothetical protein
VLTGSQPIRTLFFVVNFGAAAAWCLLCVIVIVQIMFIESGSPFALLSAVCSIGPATAFALAEIVLFFRGGRTLQRFLGAICGLVGAFAVFGFLSNVVEATTEGADVAVWFWVIFASIAMAIAAYGFLCCWYRTRN